MLSKIYFDIILCLKYDFISLEMIILERESIMEAKYLDNANASKTKGKCLETRAFHLSVSNILPGVHRILQGSKRVRNALKTK